MAEYMETDQATAEQQGDSKKISFRFCREWYVNIALEEQTLKPLELYATAL